MNRGVDRMDIFKGETDRRSFIRLFPDAAREAGVEIAAYCLMGNHFHMLLHCPSGGLSSMMWKLGAEYARWFNRRHHRDGPLFRPRFASKCSAMAEPSASRGGWIPSAANSSLVLAPCERSRS